MGCTLYHYLCANDIPQFHTEQGYDKTTAKKHLLAFALAAPLAAFLSYFGLVRVSCGRPLSV